MKRLIKKASILLLANGVVFFAWLYSSSAYVGRHTFTNPETDLNMLVIPENAHPEIVLVGGSHVKELSRGTNHEAVEEILGKRILNLSVRGGGVVPAQVYLESFYDAGNSTDTVLFFLAPWMLYSETWNEDNACYREEPFSARFAGQLVASGVAPGRIFEYFHAKFSLEWASQRPSSKPLMTERLAKRDEAEIQERISFLYDNGTSNAAFAKYARRLDGLVRLVQSNRGRVVFMNPPTLFGGEPGHARMIELLTRLGRQEGVAYHDLAQALPDPSLYYNCDHLNTEGVILLATEHIKPALSD